MEEYMDVIKHICPSDVQSIHDAVLTCGLYPYVPWQLEEFPRELHDRCGKGIGLWQYPSQFSKYMHFLYDRLKTVKTYAEIGVAAGGTYMFTTEFFRQFCGLQRSYAIDIAPPGQICYMLDDKSPFHGRLTRYIDATPYSSFVQGDSSVFASQLEHGETIDVLLIDGDHSYTGAKKDFDCMKDRASTIVFHDIVNCKCPGVVQLWNELKRSPEYEAHEFIDQYNSVSQKYLGIGVLVPKLE